MTSLRGGGGATDEAIYAYDKLYQLKTADYPTALNLSDTTYNYDPLGNRTSTVNGGTTNYTSNNLNQYSQVGASAYTYDANGNLTSSATNTYSYDSENRLVSATTPSHTASYGYDAFGRRISKTVDGVITKFLYDEDQIIAEYDGSGTLTKTYVYGPKIDETIMIDTETNKYYYHYDGLGSVTNLTDQTGSVVENYSYDAFGTPSATSSVGSIFMFTGREYDSEMGIYYYRARSYEPKIGRFLQRDPLGYLADINAYRYCNNNPVNYIDPFGLCKEPKKLWWEGIDDIFVPPAEAYDDWDNYFIESYIKNYIDKHAPNMPKQLRNKIARAIREEMTADEYRRLKDPKISNAEKERIVRLIVNRIKAKNPELYEEAKPYLPPGW